jgi:hypothetical protein
MNVWRIVLAALVLSLVAGCARPVRIQTVGIEAAAQYPRVVHDFNYGWDDEEYFDRKDREGSVRLAFETRSDLASLARGWDVTYLRYELFDCSNPELYNQSGDFFPAASNGDAYRYEAYIPARFSDFVWVEENGRVTKGWPENLPLTDGLCFQVVGFNMALLGIRSNVVRVDDLLNHIER